AEKPFRESLNTKTEWWLMPGEFSRTQRTLGACLLGQKKYDKAEPLLVEGYKSLKYWETVRFAPTPFYRWRQVETLEWLVQLYDEWGKPDEAAMWRKELEAVRRLATGGKP